SLTSATRSVASRTRATSSSRMPIALQAMGSRRGSHASWKLFRTPAEQLDTETERVPVGHPTHVPDSNRGRLQRARGEIGAHARRGGWHPGRRGNEEADQS